MEDTLRENQIQRRIPKAVVLILVLMEDTLREVQKEKVFIKLQVLILVLMEDTLRALTTNEKETRKSSLNPCFNGRYSQSAKTCVPLFIVV